MRIGEIDVVDVLAGKTWRFSPQTGETYAAPMESWEGVTDAVDLQLDDLVIYSGVYVTTQDVRPILLLKELGDLDYGGDYCEFVDGRWQQVGLNPRPDATPGQEYFAQPSVLDPSFESPDHDYRAWHRQGFEVHVRDARV